MSQFDTYFGGAGIRALFRAQGRPFIYLPVGGRQRTITAVTEEHEQTLNTQEGLMIEESIMALVLRDGVTGIDDPRLGDGLRRLGDANDVVFAFKGDKLHEQETTWQLRFTRERPYQVGGNDLK